MTSPIPFLDADAIRAATPIGELLDAIDTAYRDVAAGRDQSPLRSHVGLGDGSLLLMPGVRSGGEGASVKLVTIMPGNADRGLPTIHALVAWFDAVTGQPLALLDGAMVTAMRTGAASGVATRLLARTDASTLGVIGAGGQAEWQIRAVLAARNIRRVLVYAPDSQRRERFAVRMEKATGVATIAAESAEAAVCDADVLCCATTSVEPVFDAEWIRPGTHVNGIGAFRLGMVELPQELFERASIVAVDAREAAMAEAGDLVAAVERGLVSEADLLEIGTFDAGWAETRDPQAITVFKSVGLAIQDVAAAELIVRRTGVTQESVAEARE
ncbi:MAG: ornithine cyclodeaminase family protein [Chloroflexi bacterium]|nr:ornithine cyclodeaminase family protein [Chloroflexota bacterium]